MKEKPRSKPMAHREIGCSSIACPGIAKERLRYFTGRFLAARDLRDEQLYHRSRRYLHNRLLHGWGVVCGLSVHRHPKDECADRWIFVKPGIALDCCGRELILECKAPIELPAAEEHAEESWLLCSRYAEQGSEEMAVLDGESCTPGQREASRIVEGVELELVPFDEAGGDCWRLPGGADDIPCRSCDDCDDCQEGKTARGDGCLEPACPCGHCVPLALLRSELDEETDRWVWSLDTIGRRELPPSAEVLTHIVKITWPHGGVLSLSELRDDLGGRLEIRFDRRIEEDPDEASEAIGIQENTFFVDYGGIQQDLERLPTDDDRGPVLEDGCTAVFTIDPTYLAGKRTLVGSTLYVTLHGDFVLDCHGRPVDGDHLAGRLPSGNGIAGGTFLSWFRVVADDAVDDHKEDKEDKKDYEDREKEAS